jgi:hypothetical protein
MVRQLARVVGVGTETADMLVHEVLSRPMRDRKAVARYAGPTGSPDESGAKGQAVMRDNVLGSRIIGLGEASRRTKSKSA